MAIFDSEADKYDQWYETPPGNFIHMLEMKAVLSLLDPKEGESVLDACCGTGNYSIELAGRGCSVTGVDNSNNMLDVAKKKALSRNLNLNFVLADIHKLPFENERFDSAVCVAAVEFFGNPSKGVDEIFRTVKKGGKVVIGFINKKSGWGELYESEYFKENTVFKYARLFDISEIRSFHPDELIAVRETLYTPPGETEPSLDKEMNYSKINKPGFIAALWQKK